MAVASHCSSVLFDGIRRGVMTLPASRFPGLLQYFFQRRLVAERGAGARTIARSGVHWLLFRCAQQRPGRTPSALTLQDLDPP